jgi:DUF1680 family protein
MLFGRRSSGSRPTESGLEDRCRWIVVPCSRVPARFWSPGARAPLLDGFPEAAYAARSDTGVSVFAFPLSAVTLQAAPFLDNMNRTLAYLSFIDADRMLYNFRVTAGIATSAQPVGGWESPTTELRGHCVGHLLSALAQACGNTRNAAYKTKDDALVGALEACQAASGYLSAFPESFFDRLESGQTVWAPYYTIHKIMAGLPDR